MESTKTWIAEILEALGVQLRLGIDYLPSALGAIAVLILGWVLARIVRRATNSVAQAANGLLRRVFPSGVLATTRLSPTIITVVGEILFWSIVLVAVTTASRIAGLSAISVWLDRIAVHLPNLIVAFVIVVVGYLLSLLVREQLAPTAQGSGQLRQDASIGRFAQIIVIVIALILGLDQLGVDVILLIALAVVGASAVSVALGVSFALGVRTYMTNLIGIRTARTQLHAGQRIRVDDVEGDILEITTTQIALDTENGKTLVPGRFIDDHIIVIVTPDKSPEARDD